MDNTIRTKIKTKNKVYWNKLRKLVHIQIIKLFRYWKRAPQRYSRRDQGIWLSARTLLKETPLFILKGPTICTSARLIGMSPIRFPVGPIWQTSVNWFPNTHSEFPRMKSVVLVPLVQEIHQFEARGTRDVWHIVMSENLFAINLSFQEGI